MALNPNDLLGMTVDLGVEEVSRERKKAGVDDTIHHPLEMAYSHVLKALSYLSLLHIKPSDGLMIEVTRETRHLISRLRFAAGRENLIPDPVRFMPGKGPEKKEEGEG